MADQEALLRHYAEHRDERSREQLVEQLMPLARKLAHRYIRTSEPRDDLVQVASLGLLKAIDRFDPDRGASFSSFAVPTILGELRRHFRDTTWAVHVPRKAQERLQAIEAAIERLTSLEQTPPTVERIAEELGISVEDVLDGLLVRRAYDADPLERPEGEDAEGGTASMIDTVGAPDPGYELIEDAITVAPALGKLTEREQQVLHMRFVRELSQSQIAAELGTSQMQVSRILAATIGRIRERSGLAPDAGGTGTTRGRKR